MKCLNAKSARSITCIYQMILSRYCLNLIALILKYKNAKNVEGVHQQKQLQVNIIIVGTRNIIFKSKQQFYKKEILDSQYFHNVFITNSWWQTIIGG